MRQKVKDEMKLSNVNSIGLLISFLLMALLLRLLAHQTLGYFEELMDSFFGEDLPVITQALRDGKFFWPLYVLTLVAIIKEFLITSKVISSIVNWFFIWLIPVYVYFYVLALYLPFCLIAAGI